MLTPNQKRFNKLLYNHCLMKKRLSNLRLLFDETDNSTELIRLLSQTEEIQRNYDILSSEKDVARSKRYWQKALEL